MIPEIQSRFFLNHIFKIKIFFKEKRILKYLKLKFLFGKECVNSIHKLVINELMNLIESISTPKKDIVLNLLYSLKLPYQLLYKKHLN